jgi:hypothetical protein
LHDPKEDQIAVANVAWLERTVERDRNPDQRGNPSLCGWRAPVNLKTDEPVSLASANCSLFIVNQVLKIILTINKSNSLRINT